jgi:hypothetical protein
MRRAVLAHAAIALSVMPAQLLAQRGGFGLLGGINSSQFAASGETSGRRTSWNAGAFADFGTTHPVWFRQEILIAEKGAKESEDGATFAVKLRYLQAPLLARWNVGRSTSVQPYLLAGPSLAMRIGCSVSFEGGGESESAGCSDGSDDPFKKGEVSAIIGGGLDFGRVGFGLRYDHGLTNISRGGEAKLRTLSLHTSVRLVGTK